MGIHMGPLRGFENWAFRCLNPCLCPQESLGTQQLAGWNTSDQLAVADLLWPQDGCVTPANDFWSCWTVSEVAAELGPPDLAPSPLTMQERAVGPENSLEIVTG